MSNLLVQNIKHTNNTTAQTIDTSGRTTVSIMNNDSTYRSDDGTATQNVVQSLVKAWADFSTSGGNTLNGSFNIRCRNRFHCTTIINDYTVTISYRYRAT